PNGTGISPMDLPPTIRGCGWVAFHPDGESIYYQRWGDPGTIALSRHDLTGAVKATYQGGLNYLLRHDIDVSACGRLCAAVCASTRAVNIYATTGGAPLHSLKHRSEPTALLFAPLGPLLATAAGKTVSLWDAEAGKLVRRFRSFLRFATA